MQGVFQFFWGYSIWNLTFAMMLCALRSNQFLPSIFNNSVLRSLGKISYGLYVFHFPILGLLKFYGLPSGVFWVVGLATTIAVSYLSYTVYEKRFLKLKDLIFPKDPSLQNTTRLSKSQKSPHGASDKETTKHLENKSKFFNGF
jgi:peptidoglycan/LPS O-acetylase OafA/YrhL